MAIQVMRYKRRKILGDNTSPELYYLKRVPGLSKIIGLNKLAKQMQSKSTLTVGDIEHVMTDFIEKLLETLVEGNKVKVDGLGIFHTTFNCESAEVEKECTVKNIKQVNIRFIADNSLRLVNNSMASTRGEEHNVEFVIKNPAGESDDGETEDDPGGGGTNPGGGEIDPDA